MKRVLLLENGFKKKKKYRNLALMKFSTYFKNQGYEVDLFEGKDEKNELKGSYDYIVYATIFTYYYKADVEFINFYKNKYPNANFLLGGISATLLVDDFYKDTGIKPHKGIYEPIEFLKPDYDLYANHEMKNISEVFTARGCKNKCGFCAVKILEPNYMINPNWKDSIVTNEAMIHDNNLTTGSIEHFKDVCDFLTKNKIKTTFDNGFDCRYFTDEHLNFIKNIKLEQQGLRFAFDNMSQEGYIQRAIKKCLDVGVSKSKIMVYILHNFNDTFEDAMYRAREVAKLGVRPYPQRYRPLDDIEVNPNYEDKNWSTQLLRDFRTYWLFPGIYTKYNWNEYIKYGGYKLFRLRRQNNGIDVEVLI